MTHSNAQLALELLNTVPKIMQTIRTEMRRSRGSDLSVPQFRVLAHLRKHPGISLVETADHLGLTSPSMVSLIDALESKGLVARGAVSGDRRKIALRLTQNGEVWFDSAFQAAQNSLASRLERFSQADLHTLLRAFELLGAEFAEPLAPILPKV